MSTAKVCAVTWLDAAHSSDAVSAESIAEVANTLCVSVGFLVKRNKRGIWLAQMRFHDGEHHCPHFIPAGMIRKVRVLQ